MRRAARPLLYLGVVVAVVGLSLVHARAIADPPYSYTGTFRFGWSMVYIGLLMLTAYGFGLPEIPRTPRAALVTSAVALVTAAVGISLVQLITGDALLPRFVVFGSVLALLPWYLLCAGLASDSGLRAAARDRVLIVSDRVAPALVHQEMTRSPERPATLVAVVPPSTLLSVDGESRPLVDRVAADRISVLVLDSDAVDSDDLVAQAASLHVQGVRVRTLSLFYEQWLGMLPLADLERASLLFDISEIHRARYVRLKRLVDVVCALAGFVVLVVVVPFVVVGDLVANRGPLFFRQTRVGKQGRHFEILKFRTMKPDHDGPVNEWTADDDPRITPFGRLLRVSHLDELPQVVNVLKGDLSVVGPRPEQPRYVVELVEKLPFYDLRHLVRPGLTGWAQVKYGYAGDEADALEKLQYEFFYLGHQRLSLDLRIIGRTIRSVLGREGT